jgi:hypothetical protein
VLRETTSRGLCGLGCPSRTSERGGEGDCVKEGGGGEGKCERERALERLRYYSPGWTLKPFALGGYGRNCVQCTEVTVKVLRLIFVKTSTTGAPPRAGKRHKAPWARSPLPLRWSSPTTVKLSVRVPAPCAPCARARTGVSTGAGQGARACQWRGARGGCAPPRLPAAALQCLRDTCMRRVECRP